MIDAKTENLMTGPDLYGRKEFFKTRSKRWLLAIVLLLFIAAGAYAFRTGYLVVATVNGKPIYRWEFTNMMASRFGAQTLESMITERLITDAAKKDGVNLSKADVDAKVSEIVSTLGPNVNLDDLLKYQGMTKADFEEQIRLQLTVERILGKDVVPTDEEIEAFLTDNKATIAATEPAAMREEALQSLRSQKISEKIQPWLTDLKEKAKIVKLLR